MHISDKVVKKSATKFSESIHALMIAKPEYKEELENKKKQVFNLIFR